MEPYTFRDFENVEQQIFAHKFEDKRLEFLHKSLSDVCRRFKDCFLKDEYIMLFIKSHLYLAQPKGYIVSICNNCPNDLRTSDYIEYSIDIMNDKNGVNIVELFIQYMKRVQKKVLII